jgi:hypothetical protein
MTRRDFNAVLTKRDVAIADSLKRQLVRAEATIARLTEERDAARMGLFSHLTGEHYLAEPTYAQQREALARVRAWAEYRKSNSGAARRVLTLLDAPKETP